MLYYSLAQLSHVQTPEYLTLTRLRQKIPQMPRAGQSLFVGTRFPIRGGRCRGVIDQRVFAVARVAATLAFDARAVPASGIS